MVECRASAAVAATAAFANRRGDCSGNMLEIEMVDVGAVVVADIKASALFFCPSSSAATINLKDAKVMRMLSVCEGYAVNNSYTVHKVTCEITSA